MNIAILHALFSELGGNEVFAINLGKALNEIGFDVDFYTFELNSSVCRILDGVPGNLRVRVLNKPAYVKVLEILGSGRFIRLRRLLLYRYLTEILNEVLNNYDLVIDTQSNIPYNADISYIHFPAIVDYTLWGSRGFKRISRLAYSYLISKLCKSGGPKLILTNSSWTAKWVLKAYGNIASISVLHPPVDVKYFSEVSNKYPREKIIITISRFTPEKNLDLIVDLAKKIPNYEFIIAGSTSKYSGSVIRDILIRAKKLGIKNLKIYTNLPKDKLRELLSEARYYLHPPFPEHFGISVVEAMSAGCIPIVYRDGGVWYDVVSKVADTLGYNTIDEIVRIVEFLDNNEDTHMRLRERSIKVSKFFSYDNFKHKLLQHVNNALILKAGNSFKS
jgi:glycosyltransferase involved in cell wall biosynthesis